MDPEPPIDPAVLEAAKQRTEHLSGEYKALIEKEKGEIEYAKAKRMPPSECTQITWQGAPSNGLPPEFTAENADPILSNLIKETFTEDNIAVLHSRGVLQRAVISSVQEGCRALGAYYAHQYNTQLEHERNSLRERLPFRNAGLPATGTGLRMDLGPGNST